MTHGFMDDVMKVALITMRETRKSREPIYASIMRVCSTSHVIISDPKAIANMPESLNRLINIYADNPRTFAVGLSDVLHKEHGKWVRMKTLIAQEEFGIEFDTIMFAKVHNINRYAGIDMKTLIAPQIIGELRYMPPEIELIDVYKCLSDVSQARDWAEYVSIEQALFDMTMQRFEGTIRGGRSHSGWRARDVPTKGAIDKCDDCKIDVDKLKQILVEDLGKSGDYIITGNWAIEIARAAGRGKDKLQLISKSDIKQDYHTISTIVERYSDFAITMREQKLHIPRDSRTRRYTFYIQLPTIRRDQPVEKAFLDIFNTGCFEIIPYTLLSGHYISIPAVTARFLMIDVWIIRLIQRLGKIDTNTLATKLVTMRENLRIVHDALIQRRSDQAEYTIYSDGFYGTYIDYNILKKKEMLAKNLYYPYLPEVWFRSHGKYHSSLA